MAIDFKERLAAAREAQESGKELAKQFGAEIPAGTYIGTLQAYRYSPSGKGRPQIQHKQYITEGEQKGNVATEYIGLEHEVAIALVTSFVLEMGYEMPEIFDFEASEKTGNFVITKDFDDTLAAIEKEEPTTRFQVNKKGDYTNLRILEILGTNDNPQPDDDAEPDAEPDADPEEESEAETGSDEDQEQLDAVIALCKEEGIEEVSDEMTIEEIVKLLNADYSFWMKTVEQEQLTDFEDASPEDGIDDDAVELLDSIGCGDIIIRPVEKKAGKKKAGKKKAAKKKEPEIDPQMEALLALCVAQGIEEVKKTMTVEEAVEVLREDYVFWTKKVDQAQLKDFEGAKPADGLEDNDIELIEAVGLGDILIKPVAKKKAVKKAAVKKTAAKKSGGAKKRK